MTTIVERLVVEDDRVIMRGGIGSSILLDVAMDDEPGVAEFNEHFERVYGTGENDWHLAAEDYYQGVNVMAVIRRKSDGRLFGYQYWTPIAKHGDSHYETNGTEHGFPCQWDDEAVALAFEGEEPALPDRDGPEDDPFDVWVWLPVEPFTITGYRFPEKPDGGA